LRFFFDLEDSGKVTRDDWGVDLPNLDAARIEAIISLTEMARDWLPNDGNNRDVSVVIRGEHETLVRVSFRFEVQSLTASVPGDEKTLAHDRRRE
jgi:hypothetical protein